MKFLIYTFLIHSFFISFFIIKFILKFLKYSDSKENILFEINKIHLIQLISLVLALISSIGQSNLYGIDIGDLNFDIVDISLIVITILLVIFSLFLTFKYQRKIKEKYNIEFDYFSGKIYHWLYVSFIFPLLIYGIKYNLLVRSYYNELTILYLISLIILIVYAVIYLIMYFKKNNKNIVLKIVLIVLFVLTVIIDILKL